MVLTCSTTENGIEWLYNGVVISGSVFVESLDQVGASRSLQASGFMFSAELISIRPPVFATTLSFSADTDMNGDSVSCRTFGGQTPITQTIQVVQRGKRSACSLYLGGGWEASPQTSIFPPPPQVRDVYNYTLTTQ